MAGCQTVPNYNPMAAQHLFKSLRRPAALSMFNRSK